MTNYEIIKKECPDSIDENGKLKTLDKQLLEKEYGIANYYHPFVLEEESKILEYANIENKPLFINSSTIQKIKTKHNIDLEFIINLENVIKKSIFAIDSIQHESSKIFVTEFLINEKPIVFIIRENKKSGIYEINELTSLYDRKNLQGLIDRTIEEGGKTYINPEKIKAFEKMGYKIGVPENKKEINKIKDKKIKVL